jgi:hypothetical protein
MVSLLMLMPVLAGANEPANISVNLAQDSHGLAQHSQGGTSKPPIGRIFFSPSERRARRSGAPDAAPTAPTARGASVAPSKLVASGALSSSTQGRAVWINGVAVDSADKSAWTDRNGNIWLINGSQSPRLIRPGQSIDRSGVVEDLLPPGSVTRR